MNGSLYLARRFITKRKIRFVFLSISIVIGIASLFLLLSLQFGVQQFLNSKALASVGVNEIIVRPSYKVGILMVNKEEKKEITAATADSIKNISGVKTVDSTVVLQLPTSIKVSIFSSTFESDAPVFGVPENLVHEDLGAGQTFSAQGDVVPAVISKDLVDFYNAGFADSLGQPKINEDFLIGKELTLALGASSFVGFTAANTKEVKVRIAGLSNKVPLVGISLPLEKVLEYSSAFGKGQGKVNSLFVTVDSPAQVESISKQIETLGYTTDSLQKRINGVNDNIKILSLILGAISLIILISVAISIFNTFFSDVFESTGTIGILRSVGATRSFIAGLVLTKAGIVSLTGGAIGLLIGYVGSLIMNQMLLSNLPFFSSQGVNVTSTPWQLLVFSLLFSLLLGIVASLYPAYYASRLDPAEALRK